MSGERAAPVVVANDRTHYLHSADADVSSFEQHNITLACGSYTSLYRWHAGDQRDTEAVLYVARGPFSAYLKVNADQLRLMAYAMLQCATDIDERQPQAQPLEEPAGHPGERDYTMASVEARPWALPARAA